MQKKVNVNIGLPGQAKIKIAGGTIMIMKIKEITVAADCYNVHYTLPQSQLGARTVASPYYFH